MSKKTGVLFLALAAAAVAADPTYSDILKAFQYRNLGPFRTGAWVSALAVPETPAKAHRDVMFAGARTGGVWRTTNAGTTWEPVGDSAGITSVGALAVAPSDANVVWVGTGDNSLTRSAYWGDGVYKSTDGGNTWTNMGLGDTQHIARIVIHPTNPNIVWVAALGHLGTPNKERGVFKTTDGGKTWQPELFVNDTSGAVDLAIDSRHPDVLYAAMYDAIRLPWKIMESRPGGGIYKTTNGGAKWEKLTNGLPAGNTGRIGLDIYRQNTSILYAVVDNFSLRPGATQQRDTSFAATGSYIGGEVYRTDDAGASWRRVSAEGEDVSRKAGYSFNQLRVDPNNADRVFVTGSNMIQSNDGGKTWAGLGGGGGGGGRGGYPFISTFGDFRSFWIDPDDSDHMVATSDGGISISYDGGRTSNHIVSLKTGEVYAIGADMQQPYRIFEGLQDHENWMGPSNGWSGRVNIDDWVTVGTGDGMYNQPDPTGRWLYNTQEFGTLGRVDLDNRTRTIIDPTKAQSPHPFTNIRPLGGRGNPAPDSVLYRFNWIAPVRISPFDHNTIYYGSQFLLRSQDRGENWEVISPDLTTNNPDKINTQNTSIQHCTIVTLDESPKQAGIIWVGTDDGKVQVTRDNGAHWTDTTPKLTSAGAPEDGWVSRVFASRFEPGVAYITKSRRRQDDFRPFVFRTADFGNTWTRITNGLPEVAEAAAIAEDTVNPDLVFLGTSAGVFVSFDHGTNWVSFKSNMAPAPVTDLLIQPREGDLVVGTYGRGVWVTNIVPLRGINRQVLGSDAALLPIRSFAERNEGSMGNYRLEGDTNPVTQNEPNAMVVAFYLKAAPAQGAQTPQAGGGRRGGFGGGGSPCVADGGDGSRPFLTIADSSGKVVCTLIPSAHAGLNDVTWGMTEYAPQAEQAGGGRGGRGGRGGGQAPQAPAGEYTFTLHAGGKTYVQKATLLSRAPRG